MTAFDELKPPAPPRYDAPSRAPTTVTMRAIIDDDGADDGADDAGGTEQAVPSAAVFSVVFDRAVEAYLSQEFEAALRSFEEALRIDPGHKLCLHNVRTIKNRLGISVPDDQR